MKPERLLIVFSVVALALASAGAPVSASLPARQAAEAVDAYAAEKAPAHNLVAAYAQSKQHDDQGEARKEMKAGNQLSLREIERLVLPTMRDAEYLGPAYDAVAHAYRLKFIKDGRVMYLDVDARTGKIINRSK